LEEIVSDLDKVQQTLKAAKINEVLNKLKASAADKFFEAYPEMREGYAIYMQRRAERAKVQAPLPSGGCFVLGDPAVIAGCVAEAHTLLSRILKLPVDHIKMNIEKPGTLTGVKLSADVAVPEGYIAPVHSAESPEAQKQQIGKLTREYLEACLDQINPIFRRNLAERLESNHKIRPELRQEAIPWDGKKDTEE
jgi:hypothetical protein